MLSQSTLGPPFAVVAVARTVFVPAVSDAGMLIVFQVSQLVVLPNACAAAIVVPLTVIDIGRLVVVPLEYRRFSVVPPAEAASIVHCT